MKCPYCDTGSTKVTDTRDTGEKVRRRRECKDCERRFTTYETAEKLEISVIKQDGASENFEESKIREGIEKAVEKTDINEKEIGDIVENVKRSIRDREKIKAKKIGEEVKKELKKRDEVAYMRFASVYDSFEDAESFKEEAESLKTG